MKSVEALEILEMAGADSHGLVTTRLAAESGLPRTWVSRLTRGGQLQRLRQGVYALPSAVHDQHTAVRGAWLSLTETGHSDPDSLIAASGTTATLLYGVGNLVPNAYEFTSPSARHTRQRDIQLRLAPLKKTDIQERHGVMVTTPARTVQDLVEAGIDGDHLGDVLCDFLELGAQRCELAKILGHGAHLYGAASGRELLEQLTLRKLGQ